MQTLFDILKGKEIKQLGKDRKTERGELLTYFVSKINQERTGTKYKPVSISWIGIKTSHLDVSDLYYLKTICDKSPCWSKVFFGSLKVK